MVPSDKVQICAVCGSDEVHSRRHDHPTMGCIEYLRGDRARERVRAATLIRYGLVPDAKAEDVMRVVDVNRKLRAIAREVELGTEVS